MRIRAQLRYRPPGAASVVAADVPTERRLLIGRSAAADIFVNDPRASRNHCEIGIEGDRLVLVDCGSAAGTLVNGAPVTGSSPLAHGDRVQVVGVDVDVVVETIEPPKPPPSPKSPARHAHSRAPEPDVHPLPRSVPVSEPARADAAPPSGAGPPAPIAAFVQGAATVVGSAEHVAAARLAHAPTLVLDRPEVVIGRAPEADLVLDHPLVSRQHCRVTTGADGTFVSDTSTNGTFVGGQRVRTRLALHAGDVLAVGPFQLRFDGRALTSAPVARGATIAARRVGLVVPHTVTKKPVEILRDVELTFDPGEFVALLGASGSGKSTLLGVLNGRRAPTFGTVLLDGTDLSAVFDAHKADLSYIPQQVIFHERLPLRAALRYVARLRLPRDTDDAEIAARVDDAIQRVGLTERRDTVISQLSGGQQKRVSIAMELLARPRVMFLDEVTSGLDPESERAMAQLFRELADDGITILQVTHHTGSLELCDLAVYLTRGRLAYCGPPAGLPARFGGERIEDVYAIDATKPPERWEQEFRGTPEHAEYVAARSTRTLGREPAPRTPDGKSQVVPTVRTDAPGTGADAPPEFDPRENLRQFRILLARVVHLMREDAPHLLLMLALAPAIAMVVLFVSGDDPQPHIVWFSSMLALQFLGLFGSIWEIVNEQSVYRHERNINLRIVPYVMSKAVPLAAIGLGQSLLVLAVVSGALSGWGASHVTGLWLASVSGTMLGLAISAGAPKSDWAALLMNVVVIPQVLFAGAMIRLDGAPRTVGRWLMSSYWGYASGGWGPPDFRRGNAILSEPDRSGWECLGFMSLQVAAMGAATVLLLARKDGPGAVVRFVRGFAAAVARLVPSRERRREPAQS